MLINNDDSSSRQDAVNVRKYHRAFFMPEPAIITTAAFRNNMRSREMSSLFMSNGRQPFCLMLMNNDDMERVFSLKEENPRGILRVFNAAKGRISQVLVKSGLQIAVFAAVLTIFAAALEKDIPAAAFAIAAIAALKYEVNDGKEEQL